MQSLPDRLDRVAAFLKALPEHMQVTPWRIHNWSMGEDLELSWHDTRGPVKISRITLRLDGLWHWSYSAGVDPEVVLATGDPIAWDDGPIPPVLLTTIRLITDAD